MVVVGSHVMTGGLTRNCSLVVGRSVDRGEVSDAVVGDAAVAADVDAELATAFNGAADVDAELANASVGVAAVAATVREPLEQVHHPIQSRSSQ